MEKDDTRLIEVKYDGVGFVVDERILLECVRKISGNRNVVFKNYEDMVRWLKKCYLYNEEFLDNIEGYRMSSKYFE